MSRMRFSAAARPGSMIGAGLGQSTGFWRPQKSSGHIAVPEGPAEPVERHDGDLLPDGSGRYRDPRTAANMAERDAALAPRRWRPH